ncbi:Imm52 family immunity protein, partial [Rahnella contaminans]|uniref:Imm52 family immunity protein n=1 Tax=Rahnella contaminans TaxID=2703882 RepID=UPI0023DA0B67
MRFSTMVYYKDTTSTNAKNCLQELLKTTTLIDLLLGTKKTWYEKGYSRKQSLQHIVFSGQVISDGIIEKWDRRCKKDYPLVIEGVWDGENDNNICSVNYMRKHFHEPEKVSLEISLTGYESVIDINKIIKFIIEITRNKENAFAFINSNGYWFNERNVFPDRVCVGWMIHLPYTVLPELIPEAAKVVPVVDNGRQK